MEFSSILNLRKSPFEELEREIFFEDLNIGQIIRRICSGLGDEVEKLYYYLPADFECEAYRRDVYADIKSGEVFEALERFVENMRLMYEIQNRKEKVRNKEQKAVWHLREINDYCHAVLRLREDLKACDIRSEGFKALIVYLEEYLKSEEFRHPQVTAHSLWKELQSLRISLHYQGDRIIVQEEPMEGAYNLFLDHAFPGQTGPLKNPFLATLELTAIEKEILKLLQKNHMELFKRLENFYATEGLYCEDKIHLLYKELPFYLAFDRFRREMISKGCAFARPKINPEGILEITGLYDLALACVNLPDNKPVISNDFRYEKGDTFIVLTGPNQGGKTTFARSLGQLIYFTKMGLEVPAFSAEVADFTRILTHFSVEESVESGKGKLKEELIRLKPMLETTYQGAFVIINELFTTAANYDACIMGKRVLCHFIERGCRGIYVTHLKELCEAHESVVSARAMVDEENRQTYQVSRGEPLTSAYAIRQVNKYGLTYEQLTARLREKDIC